jgi:hypothetical protein
VVPAIAEISGLLIRSACIRFINPAMNPSHALEIGPRREYSGCMSAGTSNSSSFSGQATIETAVIGCDT